MNDLCFGFMIILTFARRPHGFPFRTAQTDPYALIRDYHTIPGLLLPGIHCFTGRSNHGSHPHPKFHSAYRHNDPFQYTDCVDCDPLINHIGDAHPLNYRDLDAQSHLYTFHAPYQHHDCYSNRYSYCFSYYHRFSHPATADQYTCPHQNRYADPGHGYPRSIHQYTSANPNSDTLRTLISYD
jgi:hypothetical protein